MSYSDGLRRQIPSPLRRDLPQGFFASPRQRRRALIVSIGVMLMLGWIMHWARLRQEAERSALANLGIQASYSEYYAPGELHLILRNLVGKRVANALCSRRITVCMPPKNFTDNTIDDLLVVRNLDRVLLYERTEQPGTKMTVTKLSLTNCGASPHGISRFHQRFPRTEVLVVDPIDSAKKKRAS